MWSESNFKQNIVSSNMKGPYLIFDSFRGQERLEIKNSLSTNPF